MRGADGARPIIAARREDERRRRRGRARGVGVQQRRLRRAHVPAESAVGADRDAQHARARLQRAHHVHLRRAARRRPPAAAAVDARPATVRLQQLRSQRVVKVISTNRPHAPPHMDG